MWAERCPASAVRAAQAPAVRVGSALRRRARGTPPRGAHARDDPTGIARAGVNGVELWFVCGLLSLSIARSLRCIYFKYIQSWSTPGVREPRAGTLAAMRFNLCSCLA